MLCLYPTFFCLFVFCFLGFFSTKFNLGCWKQKHNSSGTIKDSHPVNSLLAENPMCFPTLGFSTGKS